jgi:hypothetical protein
MKLLRNLAFSIVLAASLTGFASAQNVTTESGKTSDEVMLKIHRVDLLNQLLPLFLTKAQINDKLLPAIEKQRSKWKALLAEEDAILAKLNPQLDETISKAVEKQEYPKMDFLKDIQQKLKQMQTKRTFTQITMVDEMDVLVKEVLDPGQLKALVGSFDARIIDPTKKPDELTDGAKRAFFIRNVFLDPMCREILIDLAAKSAK